jgi:hypothetical protein
VYRVAYRLAGGRRYTVDLTLQHNEAYLGIDETLEGFRSADNADLRLDFGGLNPDRRQVMANGGYLTIHGTMGHPYSAGFGDVLEAGGKLPFELGLNTPNAYGVMRSAAFWNDQGSDALLLALDRLRDWKTEHRYVWYESRGPGNLNFYSSGGRKYLLTRLEGQRRLWALALIPREEMRNRPHLSDKRFQRQVAGPEVHLWQKLSDFSLNRRKDWGFQWDEPLGCRLYPDAEKVTYEEWLKRNSIEGGNAMPSAIINCYWDMYGLAGAVGFRAMPRWFGTYERSRAGWTEAQRQHVRAILLFMAYTSEDDNDLPHHSMLAGHPNFISDVKQTLPIVCAVFPTQRPRTGTSRHRPAVAGFRFCPVLPGGGRAGPAPRGGIPVAGPSSPSSSRGSPAGRGPTGGIPIAGPAPVGRRLLARVRPRSRCEDPRAIRVGQRRGTAADLSTPAGCGSNRFFVYGDESSRAKLPAAISRPPLPGPGRFSDRRSSATDRR